jgi:hypothetical protein
MAGRTPRYRPAAASDHTSPCSSALAVADAVLYEGYLLYPYRRSSGKNRVRWQFGVLAPRGWAEARPGSRESVAGAVDGWRQRTECLLEADGPAWLRVQLRFLHLQHRSVQQRGPDGRFAEVDSVEVAGERLLTFDEAVPLDFEVDLARGAREHTELITVRGGERTEPVPGAADHRVVRTRWPLAARVRLSISDVPGPRPLRRLRVDVENAAVGLPVDAPRAETLRYSLLATHCLLRVRDGAFLSSLDPPAWAAAAARDCVNLHTFPVLAGEDGGRDVVLSAPIIMYDHPRVAPESPGDLFDVCEIDEILTLRTLTLTDAEKREARATDPGARAIVDRSEGLPTELFERLHGAVRSLRMMTRPAGGPDGIAAPAQPADEPADPSTAAEEDRRGDH